jgi:hypothetical protein
MGAPHISEKDTLHEWVSEMTTRVKNEFDFKEWTSQFRNLVDADAHASRSWRTLTKAGVDPKQLSGLLAFACDFSGNPASKLIEQLRTDVLQEARNVLKLAVRLETDRESLVSFDSDLPEGLLEKMAEAANRLRASAKEARRLISKHKMNTTFFLAWLITSIQETVGSPRYREVSLLLECAYSAYGQEIPLIGEDSLRKTHVRFMKVNPFNRWVSPDGKRNLLHAAVLLYIVQLAESGSFLKSSKPSSASAESLMKGIEEMFGQQKDSFGS